MTQPVIITINKNRVIAASAIAVINLSDESASVSIRLNCGKEYTYSYADSAEATEAFKALKGALCTAEHTSVLLSI